MDVNTVEHMRRQIKANLNVIRNEAIKRNIEIWKSISDYPNYEVSSFGNVRNIVKQRIMKPRFIVKSGYSYIGLCKNGTATEKYVHRLVAQAFIDNVNEKKFVDHIDNNKANNNVTNLRWVSNQENQFNKQISCKNTSGVKGVRQTKNSQKWLAQIKYNSKTIYLGVFANKNDAIEARRSKAKELFGEYINACEL